MSLWGIFHKWRIINLFSLRSSHKLEANVNLILFWYLFFIYCTEYPGWPLLYPLKAPSDKCEKCPQEFCSTINYRRHSPVHHRFKKLDKVFFPDLISIMICIILLILVHAFTLLYFLNVMPREHLFFLSSFPCYPQFFMLLFTHFRTLQKLEIS